MKHKHADLIHAWANGEKIEYLDFQDQWSIADNPRWDIETEYRIKKEPVIEVKYFTNIQAGFIGFIGFVEFNPDMELWHLKITYQDGKAIKAELPNE